MLIMTMQLNKRTKSLNLDVQHSYINKITITNSYEPFFISKDPSIGQLM